jgi:hypothetical protein
MDATMGFTASRRDRRGSIPGGRGVGKNAGSDIEEGRGGRIKIKMRMRIRRGGGSAFLIAPAIGDHGEGATNGISAGVFTFVEGW